LHINNCSSIRYFVSYSFPLNDLLIIFFFLLQPSSFLIQIKGNHLITINGNVDTDIIRIGLRIFDIDSGIMTPCAIYLCGQDALFGGTQVSPVH